jgi:hypothetical protein
MTDLDALIERVRGLEGPSREVDALVFKAVGMPLPDNFCGVEIGLTWDEAQKAFTVPVGGMQVRFEQPPYTASLDAVVSLIERELPKCQWSIESGHGCITATITYRWKIGEIGATPALALLRAFFSAIKEQRND